MANTNSILTVFADVWSGGGVMPDVDKKLEGVNFSANFVWINTMTIVWGLIWLQRGPVCRQNEAFYREKHRSAYSGTCTVVLPSNCYCWLVERLQAMVCYWLTSTMISLIQVGVLRIPAVRQFFKIPALVNHKVNTHVQEMEVPQQGFMEAFRQSMMVVCSFQLLVTLWNAV